MRRAIHLLTMFWVCTAALGCGGADDAATTAGAGFDPVRWAVQEDGDHPYRAAMLDDFMASYKLNGVSNDSCLHLLGQPDRTQEGHLYYRVSQERIGPFPLHTTTLVIKLAADSTVEWVKVHK